MLEWMMPTAPKLPLVSIPPHLPVCVQDLYLMASVSLLIIHPHPCIPTHASRGCYSCRH